MTTTLRPRSGRTPRSVRPPSRCWDNDHGCPAKIGPAVPEDLSVSVGRGSVLLAALIPTACRSGQMAVAPIVLCCSGEFSS